jgi:hypothetical protein
VVEEGHGITGGSAQFVLSDARGRRPVEGLGVRGPSSYPSVPSATGAFSARGRGPVGPGASPASGSSLPPEVDPRGPRVGGLPMLRSIRPTRARRPSDASVDPTDARKASIRRFGRSYLFSG